MNLPVMWVDGNELHLTISAPSGLLYQQTFPMAVLTAKIADEGEVMRFTYDLVDPEDGTKIRGAARILIQEIPDPRAAAEETGRQPEKAGASVTAEVLFAACTPNSTPQAGVAEHGYQINVLDHNMKILATIDLPDWGTFRPASAGHRLIEQGFMIRAEARAFGKVNGWTETDGGWMVPVVRTGGD